jgi:copper chaperone CopZ
MGCPNCAIRVRNAILRLDGVSWVDIDLGTGTALVAFDAKVVTAQQFIPAVAAAGNDGRHNYQATLAA